MKTRQIESITNKLQESGYGWISKEDCLKIILLVQGELVLNAVFTPLEDEPVMGNIKFGTLPFELPKGVLGVMLSKPWHDPDFDPKKHMAILKQSEDEKVNT